MLITNRDLSNTLNYKNPQFHKSIKGASLSSTIDLDGTLVVIEVLLSETQLSLCIQSPAI